MAEGGPHSETEENIEAAIEGSSGSAPVHSDFGQESWWLKISIPFTC